MSSRTPTKIVRSRVSSGSRADVRQQPDSPARRRPSLSWTIPYPHAAVPGSMPRTFTYGSYAGVRTFLYARKRRGRATEVLRAVLGRPGVQPVARRPHRRVAHRLGGVLELLDLGRRRNRAGRVPDVLELGDE